MFLSLMVFICESISRFWVLGSVTIKANNETQLMCFTSEQGLEIGTLNETDIEWNITIADSIYCPSDRIFPKLLGTLNGRDIEWNITIADFIYCPSEQSFPKSFHYLLHTLIESKTQNVKILLSFSSDTIKTFCVLCIYL